MGLFDFLSGDGSGGVDPEGYGGPQVGQDPTAGGSFSASAESLFSDPNFLRALGQVGSGLGQGQSVGQALGTAGGTMARNKAFQAAGAESAANKQNLLQLIISSLQQDPTGKNLLGPKEDRNTLDSITMTNDGINIKAPNPGQTIANFGIPGIGGQANGSAFPDEESSLESILGGTDLPNF